MATVSGNLLMKAKQRPTSSRIASLSGAIVPAVNGNMPFESYVIRTFQDQLAPLPWPSIVKTLFTDTIGDIVYEFREPGLIWLKSASGGLKDIRLTMFSSTDFIYSGTVPEGDYEMATDYVLPIKTYATFFPVGFFLAGNIFVWIEIKRYILNE